MSDSDARALGRAIAVGRTSGEAFQDAREIEAVAEAGLLNDAADCAALR